MFRIIGTLLCCALLTNPIRSGRIQIDPRCPPKKVHILIDDDQGKRLVDHTLTDPADQTPMQIRLDSSRSYRFRIETFPPGVSCTFSGTQGDRLPADPDLVCTCLQRREGKSAKQIESNSTGQGINMRPGLWIFTPDYRFARPSPLCNPPRNSETHCVKNPDTYFDVRMLGAIDDNNCPYSMFRQGRHEGEWKRQGPKCGAIHGKVKYLDTTLDEKIFYSAPHSYCGDFTIYIKGKWLGPCKDRNTPQ
jgi:hypothetical protein